MTPTHFLFLEDPSTAYPLPDYVQGDEEATLMCIQDEADGRPLHAWVGIAYDRDEVREHLSGSANWNEKAVRAVLGNLPAPGSTLIMPAPDPETFAESLVDALLNACGTDFVFVGLKEVSNLHESSTDE